MAHNLEVSFNSPQCGWMSIGFYDGKSEFHTTTAHTPHSRALSEILKGLTSLLETGKTNDEFVIAWSRNPEAYDFYFRREGEKILFQVIEYPSVERLKDEGEIVFTHEGAANDFCRAFYPTFQQLYDDRETDEFEFNWRQPFPFEEFARFKAELERSQA